MSSTTTPRNTSEHSKARGSLLEQFPSLSSSTARHQRLSDPTKQKGIAPRMSRSNRKSSRGIDLKLNLSLPTTGNSSGRAMADEESSPSSCLSSENEHGLQWSNSPEATSMVLAACPRCFIYVMLPQDDPRCPQCKSPVLLDFLQDNSNNKNKNNNNSSRRSRRG